jgi:hypothetical protein
MDANQDIINCLQTSLRNHIDDIPRELEPLRYLLWAQLSIHRLENNLVSPDATAAYKHMMQRIQDRMKLGKERYGHGIQLNDDTRQWGTKKDSWLEMCEEEVLDGIIYSISHFLRKNEKV